MTRAIDDVRDLEIGDLLINAHRKQPLRVVRFDDRDGARTVREAILETPSGSEIRIHNQRNAWSGEISRVVAAPETPPRDARGLELVDSADEEDDTFAKA